MPASPRPERLESWKAIAAYLRRTVRTVQRWQCEGLPVHRLHHSKLGSVFAIPGELDTWCRQRAAVGAALTQRDHYCLLSEHHLRSRTVDGLQKSAKYAELALERDPEFAPAYGALALAHAVLSSYGTTPPETLMPQARAAAERGLELDPHLPEAFRARGLVELLYDWNWEAAGLSLEHALALRPSDASIYLWLAMQRLVRRQPDEALRLTADAATREPLSPMIGALRGWFLCLLRRYDDAVAVLQESIDLDPLFFRSYLTLAYAYLELGRPDMAAEAIQRASVLNGNPVFQVTRTECDARAGRHQQARARAAELNAAPGYVSKYWIARVYVWTRDTDRAFDLLKEAVETREWFSILLGHDPAFDPIRQDARFRCLLRAVGVEQAL